MADPGGGGGSRVSGHVRPRDPGGGTVPTVGLVPSRVSTGFRQCGPRRPLLVGDTLGRECPHDDIEDEDRVPSTNIEGCRPSPVLPGACFQ